MKTRMRATSRGALMGALAATLLMMVSAEARAADEESSLVSGPVPPPHLDTEPAETASLPPAEEALVDEEAPGPDWSALKPLGGHYSARYRSDNLPIHGGAGTRVGRGEIAYSIPIAGPLYLRSGVLLDYLVESAVQPSPDPSVNEDRQELGGTATVGFEVRF
jgi:hypothetical protein